MRFSRTSASRQGCQHSTLSLPHFADEQRAAKRVSLPHFADEQRAAKRVTEAIAELAVTEEGLSAPAKGGKSTDYVSLYIDCFATKLSVSHDPSTAERVLGLAQVLHRLDGILSAGLLCSVEG